MIQGTLAIAASFVTRSTESTSEYNGQSITTNLSLASIGSFKIFAVLTQAEARLSLVPNFQSRHANTAAPMTGKNIFNNRGC